MEEFKRQLKALTVKLKEAENRAEYAEKTVKKLQKEVDRLEGRFFGSSPKYFLFRNLVHSEHKLEKCFVTINLGFYTNFRASFDELLCSFFKKESNQAFDDYPLKSKKIIS